MVSFPNAKINIGLNVVEKRTDGFHNIETVFLPVSFKDVLEIIVSDNKTDVIEFTSSGIEIDGGITNNLCVKAYHLLKKEFDLPNIKMHLHKTIPIGAGLGGGSADAAFTLQLLNNKFSLNLTENQLLKYALQLGSDCPFFIKNKPCFATSRGENLEEIQIDLSNYQLAIINPKIHIATAWAFNKIKPQSPAISIKKLITLPIESWKNNITNDFEIPVFNEFPVLSDVKEIMYKQQAIYAALTGTGSTVFGIFKKNIKAVDFSFPENYFIKWIDL